MAGADNSSVDDYRPEPGFAFEVRRVGSEQTPVILVDDALPNHRALIDHACREDDFQKAQRDAYPGVKAKLPESLAQALLPAVAPMLYRLYRVPAKLKLHLIDEVYSLISVQPEQLRLLQRMPHYDNHSPHFFALLLYLQEGDFGGTGFFRHRPTGFECIGPGRAREYIAAAQHWVRTHGEPPMRYLQGSDEHFELIDSIEYRPNRLVIYPGNLLHSGLVQPRRDIDPNPRSGRLTANLFVEFV